MGTSGSYSGSGGAIGGGIRDAVGEWLDSIPTGEGQPAPDPGGPEGDREPQGPERPKLNPNQILPIVGMLRPRSPGGAGGDGPGGGGTSDGSGGRRGGGPGRSVVRSASTAGRAAAAAYAFRTGDAATLGQIGLDFAELAALGDPFEVTRRIVEAACGPTGESTIEDHEQRLVAAEVAEWVLTQGGEQPPAPEEIVRHTIVLVITEAVLSETGELVSKSEHAGLAESEIRDAAEAIVAREEIPAEGVSEAGFTGAIERGIETLRGILDGGGGD